MAGPRVYPLLDYTRVTRQPKKIHDFLGMRFKNGLDLPGLTVGGIVGIIVCVAISAVLLALTGGNPFMVGWGLGAGAGSGIGVYFITAFRIRDTTTPLEMGLNWVIGTIVQPQRLSGFSKDRDPTHIHWVGILWHPTDETWRTTRLAAEGWAKYRKQRERRAMETSTNQEEES